MNESFIRLFLYSFALFSGYGFARLLKDLIFYYRNNNSNSEQAKRKKASNGLAFK